MTADKERSYRPPLSKKLPELLPEISLRHGQAIWLLTELGFGGDATQATFYEYIKSLRKLGIPFDNRAVGTTRGGAVKYSYQNLMELALALTLRVYYVVPDSVLVGIIQYRRSLYGHYRRAYAERCTGKGAPIALKAEGCPPICMRGVFLDLQLNFSGGSSNLARQGRCRHTLLHPCSQRAESPLVHCFLLASLPFRSGSSDCHFGPPRSVDDGT
jgi:hypothetical protein